MAKRSKYVEVKPVEDWTTKEWETAYNSLNDNFAKLKNKMRKAMNCISQAQQWLSESMI